MNEALKQAFRRDFNVYSVLLGNFALKLEANFEKALKQIHRFKLDDV